MINVVEKLEKNTKQNKAKNRERETLKQLTNSIKLPRSR